MLIFPGMLFRGNPEHNALKAGAVLGRETSIARLLRIYLLTVYITDRLIYFAAVWYS